MDEELRRVLPVVRALAADARVPLSIDTTKPEVADACLRLGARIVNDITGLRNPEMIAVAARHNAAAVIMHMRGTPRNMQLEPVYDDVVAEVRSSWPSAPQPRVKRASRIWPSIPASVSAKPRPTISTSAASRRIHFSRPARAGRTVAQIVSGRIARPGGHEPAPGGHARRGGHRGHEGSLRGASARRIAMPPRTATGRRDEGRMNDRIHLLDVALECRIGVSAEERRNPQQLLADVTVATDIRPAAARAISRRPSTTRRFSICCKRWPAKRSMCSLKRSWKRWPRDPRTVPGHERAHPVEEARGPAPSRRRSGGGGDCAPAPWLTCS